MVKLSPDGALLQTFNASNPGLTWVEAVAVDKDDNIYTGFTNVPNFRRWVKN